VVLPVCVEFAGRRVAETIRALRVVETSSPPTYYLPPDDVRREFLERESNQTFCEWKGVAHYWTLRAEGRVSAGAAWSYARPDEGFQELRHYLAFHAGRVDACFVGSDRVVPQPGEYYGGWITRELVGPFKGEPGSERW
jgi:uncharacterized protein (DUF427 family)